MRTPLFYLAFCSLCVSLSMVAFAPRRAFAEDDFQRTQAVLEHFNVPAQADPQPELDALSGLQTSAGLQSLLKYFDPGSQFSKYATLSSSEVDFDQDPQGHEVPDFSASLRDASAALPESALTMRLLAARANPADQPLLGLRIALDPGHMGGSGWDQITGKWIRDAQDGRYLSEGVINLQTALLLESSLSRLGAQVMVTRHTLAPVSSADFSDFDMNAGALRELRESTLLSWFQNLIAGEPIGTALFDSFASDATFKDVFSDSADNRWDYYNDLDLQARVDAITAFHPDITLIIHYDVSPTNPDPHGLNPGPAGTMDATKVYVPGALSPSEFASRDDRAQFALHLLDQTTWDDSVAFARDVATSLSMNLKIPFAATSPGLTTVVAPGVFSRNLYVLRTYQQSAMAYAECLFYSDPGEFNAFYNTTHPMTIGGQNLPYSDRLALVADSLKQAIVKFVQGGN